MGANELERVGCSHFSVKYKEGIHFPEVNQLLKLVRENEDMKHQLKLKKQRFAEEAKRNNIDDYSDEYDDEDDA